MSSKFHIGKKGPAACKARFRPCPLGGEESHYATREEAEQALAHQYSPFASLKQVTIGEARSSYRKLLDEDAAIEVTPKDPEQDDELLVAYLTQREDGQEVRVQHNALFVPPRVAQAAQEEEQAKIDLSHGQTYVDGEALRSLREGVLDCRRQALHFEMQGDEAAVSYMRGWQRGLENLQAMLTDELAERRVLAEDFLKENMVFSLRLSTLIGQPDTAAQSQSYGVSDVGGDSRSGVGATKKDQVLSPEEALRLKEDISRLADKRCGELLERHEVIYPPHEGHPRDLTPTEKDGYRDAMDQVAFDAKGTGQTMYLARGEDGSIQATQLYRF